MEKDQEPIKRIGDEAIPEITKNRTVASSFWNIVREVLAIVFWIYLIVKLFIFDIDVILVKRFTPEYAWLLNLKFFILIGFISIFWFITKSKYILIWTSYIIFYPAIILLWKIPYFVIKQKSWLLAFALINAFVSFFTSLKYNFITASIFLISIAIIFVSSNYQLLWLSVSAILLTLMVVYIHRFVLVFKPSSLFQIYTKIFSAIREKGVSLYALDEGIRNLPMVTLNESQLTKWTANLQTAVLYNRICLFVARKLRDYQNSRLNYVSYVLTLLLLILITAVAFAAIYYGLYKIKTEFFTFTVKPTFFTFFYYSFNHLFFNSIPDIMPATPISKTASMIESFFVLFLVVILVSLLMSVKSQKYTEELDGVIREVQRQGISMEGFIKEEYKLNSIQDAIRELEKLKAGLIKFIYILSQNVD
jgi:hypothetical protein